MSTGYLALSEFARIRKIMHAPALSRTLPSELVDALEENLEAKEAFHSLPPERQRGYIQQIAGAKKSRTRFLRARRLLTLLLERAT